MIIINYVNDGPRSQTADGLLAGESQGEAPPSVSDSAQEVLDLMALDLAQFLESQRLKR